MSRESIFRYGCWGNDISSGAERRKDNICKFPTVLRKPKNGWLHRRKLMGGGLSGASAPPDENRPWKIRKCFTNFEISLLYYWFHA